MVRIVKFSWQTKTKRMAPKRPPKSILKLREKSNPLSLFIRDRERELYSHDVYMAENALKEAFKYKSLTQTGFRNLYKLRKALSKYESSVFKNAQADDAEKKAAERAKKLLDRIDNFMKDFMKDLR